MFQNMNKESEVNMQVKKLTEKTIEKLNVVRANIEETTELITEADKMSTLIGKIIELVPDDEVWDIFDARALYEDSKIKVAKRVNYDICFDCIFYAENLLDEYDRIKDLEEVIELIQKVS